MKRFAVAVAALAAAAAVPASAGEFSVSCSYKNENLSKCAVIVADLVTDKFVARYPASRFEIFVHSNIHSYTDGGFSAYAVAGVVPRGSNHFPLRTFSSSNINGGSRKFNHVELAQQELQTYRAVVKNLMEQCEISPNCDVYTARK